MTPQRGKPHPPTKHEVSAEVKAWKPLPEWPRSGQMPRTRKAVPNTESELFLHIPPSPATSCLPLLGTTCVHTAQPLMLQGELRVLGADRQSGHQAMQ